MRILNNPNVIIRIYKSRPFVTILYQMNPVHVLQPCFFKIYFNIIFPSTPTSFEVFFPSGLQTETQYAFILLPMHVTPPAKRLLLILSK